MFFLKALTVNMKWKYVIRKLKITNEIKMTWSTLFPTQGLVRRCYREGASQVQKINTHPAKSRLLPIEKRQEPPLASGAGGPHPITSLPI
ncbi:MAG: hypothetical protein JWP81_3183 [Ferruginibacter sp.]|nr:hypothetical protein [Ferruginibacter sp.]